MHHDLVHLSRIGEDRAPAWLPVVLEGDGAREGSPQERQGCTDNLVELHRCAHRGALAAEGQELLHHLLGSQPGLEDLLEQMKRVERERKTLQGELAKVQAGRLVAQGKALNGITLVCAAIDHADRELLATVADAVRGQLKTGAVLLASKLGAGEIAWVMALTADVVARKLHAGQLLKEIAAVTQGGGGGRPDFAQAGGKDPSKIPQAMKRAEELLSEALT